MLTLLRSARRDRQTLPGDDDIEQQQQHHQQDAVGGRVSAFNAFVQAAVHPGAQTAASNSNAAAASAAAAAAAASATAAVPAPAAAPAATAARVSRRVRLERDANATLFGPSLATYFPSSTSAASASASAAAAPASAPNHAAQPPGAPPAEGAARPTPEAGQGEGANHAADANIANPPTNQAPPAFAPLTTVSSINSATLRRPRLGSSGRARGASLSNLSVASLLHPSNQTPQLGNSVESPQTGVAAAPFPAPTTPALISAADADNSNANSPYAPTRAAFPFHRRQYTTDSIWSYPDHGRADNDDDLAYPAPGADAADDFGPLPLADAIQLGTLQRWLERAAGGGGATLHPSSVPPPAAAGASVPASPGTTTHSANDIAPLDPNGHEGIPLTDFGPSPTSSSPPVSGPASVCTILQSYVNLKRNTFRLTLGPAAARPSLSEDSNTILASQPSLPPTVLPPAPSAPVLAHPTHILHFEYDCAAPRCAIHVFVRASRKHGSWNSAAQNPAYPDVLAKAATAQSGSLSPQAPPHILGFPILAATTITARPSGQATHATITPASIPSEAHHLPMGFAQKRAVALRLDMSLYAPPCFSGAKDKEGPAAAAKEEASTSAHHAADMARAPADVAAEVDAAAAAAATRAEEAKDKSKAEKEKTKADKETLKVAIVVEALDEEGKPLPDPNLQTTYLRLTSVPAPAGSAASVPGSDGKMRVWSAQVEAQEAEIGPHRFTLQELFGLSSRPPPASLARPDNAAGDTTDGAFLTGNTDGAAGVDAADGEEPLAEIPTEVPAGSTTNLNSSSAALGQGNAGSAPGVSGDGNGFTPTYMPPADEGTTGSECLICLTSPPSTLLLPCTHGLCLECAIQLRESVKNARDAERRRGKTPRRKYACPVCRRAYTSMLHLSTADEKQLARVGVV